MPAPRLEDIAKKACIKYARHLNDVGDFEYWKIKPILQRIDSPEQLHQIELRSPQIKGEDAELWQAFIARDIPNWLKKNYIPKNPMKWYEVYLKYKREQQREIEKDEEILMQQMGMLKKQKETNVSQVVDLRKLPKLPRDPRMLAQNGGAPLKQGARGGTLTGAMSWGGGSRTKTGGAQGVLLKAKREAKEIRQMNKLSRPAHQLSGRPGQITKAPAAMVNDHRKATLPAIKILSRRRDPVKVSEDVYGGPSLEERENRLRALTTSQIVGGGNATWVGSSDEEEDDEFDKVDSLFDDTKSKAQQTAPSLVRSVAGSRPSTSVRPAPQTSTPSRLQPTTSSRVPTLTKPATTPIATTKSQPHFPTPPPSTTKPAVAAKFSSATSKVETYTSSAPLPKRTSSPAQNSRSSTPAGRPPSMKPMMRKRPQEVDIFNRGKKKARIS